MKSWSIILTAAFLLFLTSSHASDNSNAQMGEVAPNFSIKNDYGVADIQMMRGKYLLLSFWSASDPQSRIDNAQYAHSLDKNDNEKINLISINIDADKQLWQQLVEIDDLDASSQYSAQELNKGNITDEYNLESGNRAYLINPYGTIVAVNPSISQLMKLI